ncbi:MAG: AMP-binding protein [Crocinitomicaceae bacterium]
MLNDIILLDDLDETYLQSVKDFITEWENDSTSITVATSGSTGEPKIYQLDKEKVRRSALATGQFFDFVPGETILLNLSPNYIAGKLLIVRAIEHQMKLIVAPLSVNPLSNCEILIDFAAFVPSQVAAIMKNPETKQRYNAIKNVIIGGAPLSTTLENEIAILKTNSYASFGMTETITHFALRKTGTPIYRCLDGFDVGVDNRSCLVIKPNPIVEETLITNDVIDLVDDTSFKWRGRFDFVINSGGIKIHPEKVEKMIGHLIPSNNFYITSKQDSELGEIAILLIEGEFEIGNLLEDAKSFLPKYHAPKEVYLKGAFNYTESGKVIREKF